MQEIELPPYEMRRVPMSGRQYDQSTPEPQAAGARLWSDVDRCEHGRHFGDVCGNGCEGGVSLGHPATRDGHPAVIAYGLDGARWLAPAGRGHAIYEAP